jgi:hypothetical protein
LHPHHGELGDVIVPYTKVELLGSGIGWGEEAKCELATIRYDGGAGQQRLAWDKTVIRSAQGREKEESCNVERNGTHECHRL